MITEIYIENHRLDIYNDLSALLTFAIDDIKDFATRSTTFSKTVVIPGTANNNALFGNIFEVGISNDYSPTADNVGYNFNAAKAARCYIFQDNLQTFKGTLRLLEIVKDKGRMEYEVALNGELTGLNVALSSRFLEDLDFSLYDQTYSYANIVASWDNAGGSGIYYPLIDYGTYSTGKHNWDIRTFRPALYVKQYIDKMFAASNYRYSSALLNTARFKGLVVPHNRKKLTKLGSSLLSASIITGGYAITADLVEQFDFESISGTDFIGQGGPPPNEIKYTGTSSINADLAITITGTYTSDFGINVGLYSYNGLSTTFLAGQLLPGSFGTINNPFTITFTLPATLFNPNDALYIQLGNVDTGTDSSINVSAGSVSISALSTTTINVNPGDTLVVNDTIPKNIRQVDFLVSIVKLFNLYVYEDPLDDRLIHITPYIDFYDGTTVDWTYKLNRDEPIRVKPMSELNSKIYDFSYKADSDYFNELYKNRYNQGYGSYIYDTQFEFASQTNRLELIFAATPMVGYVGEDKVYSTIFKRTGPDSAPVEESMDSVIRILQTKKMTATSWNMLDGATVLGSPTSYGYAGHFDDPTAIDNDLNFGALKELFFTLIAGNLSNTQFNIYWSAYMAEITDKDSKLLTAKFYLTPKDIFDLRFSKYVMVDGVLFRLNKITDYNASTPGDCTVELLTVISSSYTFPPISRGGSDFFLLWNDLSPLADFDTQNMLYV